VFVGGVYGGVTVFVGGVYGGVTVFVCNRLFVSSVWFVRVCQILCC